MNHRCYIPESTGKVSTFLEEDRLVKVGKGWPRPHLCYVSLHWLFQPWTLSLTS